MPSYDIALIVTIEAESYAEAIGHADHLATGIGMEGECISRGVCEYDNQGRAVIYLHAIDSKEG